MAIWVLLSDANKSDGYWDWKRSASPSGRLAISVPASWPKPGSSAINMKTNRTESTFPPNGNDLDAAMIADKPRPAIRRAPQ